MKILSVRKDEEYYYEGPFWILSNSVKDIHRGNFELLSVKFVCDYDGNIVDSGGRSKSGSSHKNIWNRELKHKYDDVEYNYYPRGRVAIYKGTAFIHINSLCNTPKVINNIVSEYKLDKLDIEVELNDEVQGSHYDFLLD